MSNVRQKLIKETKTCFWYAVISTVAAIFVFCETTDRVYRGMGTGVDVNLAGMFGKMIGRDLVPFLCIFLILSTVRIAIVCFWKNADK